MFDGTGGIGRSIEMLEMGIRGGDDSDCGWEEGDDSAVGEDVGKDCTGDGDEDSEQGRVVGGVENGNEYASMETGVDCTED